jgi:putative transposase
VTCGNLYYRLVVHRGRRGERRSLSEADYAALLAAAHQQLHAPIILIWDNLTGDVGRVV